MSSSDVPPGQVRPERSQYTFRLLDRAVTDGHCVIEAKAELDSSIRWNPDCPSDPRFNLSAMIGNDNASFKWGRSAFERTGCDFKLMDEPGTCACILTGKLVNLNGEYKDAFINLDERLKVEEYIDVGKNQTYHRLTWKEHPAPETGVGTYSPPGMLTPAGLAIASKLDEAVAWYLYQHVIDGYRFLMQTYRLGDRIALFGFSRGAFTARALAGMLHSVGLLPRHNVEHIPFAYEVYKNDNSRSGAPISAALGTMTKAKPRNVDPTEFKRTFCVPVTVDYVGVWDTVASVGALIPQSLPWIDYNPSILTFRQALALDERRGNFIPSVWDHRRTTIVQDVKEVWFKGEHSDVGGGSSTSDNKDYNMLSNITLRWMVRQILQCRIGILFDHGAIELYRKRNILEIPPAEGLRPCKEWMIRLAESRKLDQVDIKNDIYNSIGWSLLWNGLEYFAFTAKPTKTANCEPTISRWPHAKAGCEIFRYDEKDPIYIHSSVVDQLASYGPTVNNKDYKPRAKWYGYHKQEWPRVEDISSSVEHSMPRSGASIPDDAKLRLSMIRPSASKKRRWGF
ncbi:unnamed protein product [Rhizoctonia solani]|uniref:Cyanovirin-N domain-containing protein n=1 Tax=Rhizoctonia solani TaxID=456999 RepID=A0A8H2WAJ0_9AGAM|nr:unnamed protein product [Rhizoctonia solani]